MTATTRDTVSRNDPRRVVGYRRKGDDLTPSNIVDTSFKLAGGGLSATATDMARFGAAFASGRLLPLEHSARMLDRVVLPDGTITQWGTGWQIPPFPRPIALMTGQQEEATALLIVDPGSGVALAILSNRERSANAFMPLMIELMQIVGG